MKSGLRSISAMLVMCFTVQYTAYPITTEELQRQQQQMTGQYSPAQEQTQIDEVQRTALLNTSGPVSIEPASLTLPISDEELAEGKVIFGNTAYGEKTPWPLTPGGPTVIKYFDANHNYLGQKVIAGSGTPADAPVTSWIDKNNKVLKHTYANNISVRYEYDAAGNIVAMIVWSVAGVSTKITKESIGGAPLTIGFFSLEELKAIDSAAKTAAKKTRDIVADLSLVIIFQLSNFNRPTLGSPVITFSLTYFYGQYTLEFWSKGGELVPGYTFTIGGVRHTVDVTGKVVEKRELNGDTYFFQYTANGTPHKVTFRSADGKTVVVWLNAKIAPTFAPPANLSLITTFYPDVKFAPVGIYGILYSITVRLPDGSEETRDKLGRLIKQILNDPRKSTFEFMYDGDNMVPSKIRKTFGVPSTDPKAVKEVIIYLSINTILVVGGPRPFTAVETLNDGTTNLYDVRLMSMPGIINPGEVELAKWSNGGIFYKVVGKLSPVWLASKVLDPNGDGKITVDELKDFYLRFTATLGKSKGEPGFDAPFDFNQDNRVGAADWEAVKEALKTTAWGAGIVRAFETIDKDHDLRISVNEAVEGAQIARKILAALVRLIDPSLVAAYDFDQNGKVDTVDAMVALQILYISGHEPIFKAVEVLDPNIDGTISLDELKAAYQGFLAAMKTYNVKYDFNKDNRVDRADWEVFKAVAKTSQPRVMKAFEAADRNGDLVVSLKEFYDTTVETFRRSLLTDQYPYDPRYDFDGNGRIANVDVRILYNNLGDMLGFGPARNVVSVIDTEVRDMQLSNKEILGGIRIARDILDAFARGTTGSLPPAYDFDKDGRITPADAQVVLYVLFNLAGISQPMVNVVTMVDQNNDGDLSPDETRRAFGISRQILDALVKGVAMSLPPAYDFDKNGKINLADFDMLLNTLLNVLRVPYNGDPNILNYRDPTGALTTINKATGTAIKFSPDGRIIWKYVKVSTASSSGAVLIAPGWYGVLNSTTYYAPNTRADYAVNYEADGRTVATTHIFYYGNGGGVRAIIALPSDALMKTDEYRGLSIAGGSLNRVKTTFFSRHLGPGNEITDYAVNYKTDGVTIAESLVFFYAGGKRAPQASINNAIVRIDTFNGLNLAGPARVRSVFYIGIKNSEIADYALSYKPGGIILNSMAIYYYGPGFVRAMVANPSMNLTRIDDSVIGRMDFNYSNPLSLTVTFKKPTDRVAIIYRNVHLGPPRVGEVEIAFGYSGLRV